MSTVKLKLNKNMTASTDIHPLFLCCGYSSTVTSHRLSILSQWLGTTITDSAHQRLKKLGLDVVITVSILYSFYF